MSLTNWDDYSTLSDEQPDVTTDGTAALPASEPAHQTTSSRVILKTEKGMVNKDEVKKLTAETIPHDAPLVRAISSNQS